MAANMQHMAGAGQMTPQQQQQQQQQQLQFQQHARSSANQYGQTIMARLSSHPVPNNGWQATVNMGDRVGKALELFTNITLGTLLEPQRALEVSITFEVHAFSNCTSKEQYYATIKNKIVDFFKRRQANSGTLQNGLNANAQAQAQAQQQAQQQAMLNMQQMGRGFGPQQGFGGMAQGMQGQQMPNHQQMLQLQHQQQQQQQQHQQQQQQQQMAASMGMANQGGRGMAGPGQQMGMGPGIPGQARPNIMGELARLPPGDREKVNALALRMFNQATENVKTQFRNQVRSKMAPQQVAEFQAQNRDPALIVFQTQAFQTLKNSANRAAALQAGGNMTPQQAAMMQQQNSQQRANNMMGNAQQAGHDFSQFGPSMESIKDQQRSGLIAQQAGQMVVPASGAARNATPQPGNQNMPNHGQNQTPRQGQQQPGQQQQNQQQQMKLNQSSQQAQAAQMKQMQSQQGSAMDQNQSPANRGPMGTPGGQHGNMPFGNQQMKQGGQGNPNMQAMLQAMLSGMSPEQRQHLQQFPQEKVMEMVRRWAIQQQQQRNAGQMGANQSQQQMQQNQLNQNAGGAGLQAGMQSQQQQQQPQQQQQQQPPQQGQQQNAAGPQQGPGGMGIGSAQMQNIMDNLDVPPQVRTQVLVDLPPEVKKWRDLKQWVHRQGSISQHAKAALSQLQKTQFQHLWTSRRMAQQMQMQQQQQGQQPPQMGQQPQQGQPGQQGQQQPGQQGQQNMMLNGGMNMTNMPPNMANFPAHLLQVTPHEMAQVRASRPDMTDEQVRMVALQMKRTSWQNQQANRMRAQSAASQGLGPQNPMAGPNMSQQQNQNQAQDAKRQQQQPPHQQPLGVPMPGAAGQSQAAAAKQPTPQQPAKNLKRPSTDDAADAGGARPNNAAGQKRQPAHLTPDQISRLTPEQKAKYDMFLRAQTAGKEAAPAPAAAPAAGGSQPTNESISRLKAIGQEAARQVGQEPVMDIPMSPQELEETGVKLKRIVLDMGKVGRGLTRWFAITGDEGRARMFFKFRQRLLKQFVDGDAMTILRDSFSMRSSDLEQARAMLESMARDLHASMKGGMMKTQNSQQQQPGASQATAQGGNDQSSPATAPLNASNLEKNSQALNKQKGKSANQPPPAPTVAQAPGFPTNASSPHGNPSYMSKAKDMNLQIPPRKKQKVGPQSGQAANTPSPRVNKTASPEVKRAPEPPKPVFLCKEADCDVPSVGFPTEQALKQHVEEEHVKPREDPVKFVQENLALALGLEMDGTVKKSGDGPQAMSASGSKQGQDVKGSGSALSRVQSATGNGTPKAAEATTPGSDPWAASTIDTQALLSNLGFENGLPTVMNEFQLYRSLTPNDTPESSKDSGASEPNSDISEGAALDIDMNWQSIDTDLLLDLNSTSLSAGGTTLDPSLLLDPLAGPPPDWDDMTVDFNKPFQFDTSHYSFDTSA